METVDVGLRWFAPVCKMLKATDEAVSCSATGVLRTCSSSTMRRRLIDYGVLNKVWIMLETSVFISQKEAASSGMCQLLQDEDVLRRVAANDGVRRLLRIIYGSVELDGDGEVVGAEVQRGFDEMHQFSVVLEQNIAAALMQLAASRCRRRASRCLLAARSPRTTTECCSSPRRQCGASRPMEITATTSETAEDRDAHHGGKAPDSSMVTPNLLPVRCGSFPMTQNAVRVAMRGGLRLLTAFVQPSHRKFAREIGSSLEPSEMRDAIASEAGRCRGPLETCREPGHCHGHDGAQRSRVDFDDRTRRLAARPRAHCCRPCAAGACAPASPRRLPFAYACVLGDTFMEECFLDHKRGDEHARVRKPLLPPPLHTRPDRSACFSSRTTSSSNWAGNSATSSPVRLGQGAAASLLAFQNLSARRRCSLRSASTV